MNSGIEVASDQHLQIWKRIPSFSAVVAYFHHSILHPRTLPLLLAAVFRIFALLSPSAAGGVWHRDFGDLLGSLRWGLPEIAQRYPAFHELWHCGCVAGRGVHTKERLYESKDSRDMENGSFSARLLRDAVDVVEGFDLLGQKVFFSGGDG